MRSSSNQVSNLSNFSSSSSYSSSSSSSSKRLTSQQHEILVKHLLAADITVSDTNVSLELDARVCSSYNIGTFKTWYLQCQGESLQEGSTTYRDIKRVVIPISKLESLLNVGYFDSESDIEYYANKLKVVVYNGGSFLGFHLKNIIDQVRVVKRCPDLFRTALKRISSDNDIAILENLKNLFDPVIMRYYLDSLNKYESIFLDLVKKPTAIGIFTLLDGLDKDFIKRNLLRLHSGSSVAKLILDLWPSFMFSLFVSQASEPLAQEIMKLMSDDMMYQFLFKKNPYEVADFFSKSPKFELFYRLAAEKILIEYLLNEPSWQTAEMVAKVFAAVGDKVAIPLLREYSKGKQLSSLFIEALKKTPMPQDDEALKTAWEELHEKPVSPVKSLASSGAPEVKAQSSSVTLANGVVIALDHPRLVASVWQEGLSSSKDLQILLVLNQKPNDLQLVCDELCKQRKVLNGMGANFEYYKPLVIGNSTLEDIFKLGGEAAFLTVINLLPKEKMRAKLNEIDPKSKRKFFTFAAEHMSDAAFNNFVNDWLDYEAADESFLMIVMQHKVCSTAILNKLEFVLYRYASYFKDETAVHLAAQYQTDTILIALIESLDSPAYNAAANKDRLTEVFIQLNKKRQTILHLVAMHQLEEIFERVLNHLDKDIVSEASRIFTSEGESVLELVLFGQSAKAAVSLLNMMDDFSLDYVLKRGGNVKPLVLKKILNNLLYEESWQTKEIIDRIFTILGDVVVNTINDAWLDGVPLSDVLLNFVSDKLFDGKLDAKPVTNLILQDAHNPWRKFNAKKPVQGREVITSQNTRLDLNAVDVALTVWQEGFKHIGDYHFLRNQKMIPGMTSTLDRLYMAQRIFSGCVQAFGEESKSGISLEEINHCIASGHGLVQLVHPDNLQETLIQLAESRVPDSQIKCLSARFNTPLIGDEKLPALIGLLYDSEKCVVVPKDNASGSLPELKMDSVAYSSSSSSSSSNSANHNVVVHKSALAIVIVEDTLVTRAAAERCAESFFAKFGIVLPIIFYNSTLRSTHMYLPEMMAEDQMLRDQGRVDVPILLEQEAKARMLKFKEVLEDKKDWVTYGKFFGMMKRAPTEQPNSAKKFVSDIATLADNPNTFWIGAYDTMVKQVNEVVAQPSKYASDDTKTFYQTQQKRYFN